ncbi:hypothetical protein TUM3811_23400 [Shewanella algae]|nr:hypothetical protein TUM3811_23400 [Shewanella algae]
MNSYNIFSIYVFIKFMDVLEKRVIIRDKYLYDKKNGVFREQVQLFKMRYIYAFE